MTTKQILFSGFMLAVFSATALQSQAQGSMSVRAGTNFNKLIVKDGDGKKVEGHKFVPGINIGVTYNMAVADEFFVQPSVLFTTKGTKLVSDDDHQATSRSFHLEVPVNFVYKKALGAGKILLGAGPYVAYGFGGRWKANFDGESTSRKLSMKNNYTAEDWTDFNENEGAYPYTKPLDYGANILAGYEFSSRLSAQLNGQMGLAELAPNFEGEKSGFKAKNMGISISFGYKF